MKHSAAFLLVIITLVYACTQDEFVPSDYFVIRKNEVLSISTGIKLIADTVSVSICPKDANCILADNAFVSLMISRGTQSKRLRLFAIPPTHSWDSSGVDFGDAQYKVILRTFRYVYGSSNSITNEVTVQVSKL